MRFFFFFTQKQSYLTVKESRKKVFKQWKRTLTALLGNLEASIEGVAFQKWSTCTLSSAKSGSCGSTGFLLRDACLQFVTWLVYFSERAFRAHLCPGLISKWKSPAVLRQVTRLGRRASNEAWPRFLIGGGGSCRDRSQKCVFTFIMCFPKLSSRQLKFRFFTKKRELFQPPELSLELEDTGWIADISGMSIVLKWNMKVSTPGSHTASAVCPNRQKWSRALLLGACTYELTDMSRDDRELLTLVCVWKPGMLPKLKPE